MDDETEIVRSEILEDKRVKVYVEKPDSKGCFHHMTCYWPKYEIEDVYGFNQSDVDKYMEIIKSTSHLIMQFSKEGGFDSVVVWKMATTIM